MARFSLLLVDAVIVIYLFEIGLWEDVLAQCDIHISEIILREANFWEDNDGNRHPTNIERYRARMTVHPDAPASVLEAFQDGLGDSLRDTIHAGEAELLCLLSQSLESYTICSADAAVFRYLGATQQSGQGVSLQEILERIGRTKQLTWQFTKSFKEKYCRDGFTEALTQSMLRAG